MSSTLEMPCVAVGLERGRSGHRPRPRRRSELLLLVQPADEALDQRSSVACVSLAAPSPSRRRRPGRDDDHAVDRRRRSRPTAPRRAALERVPDRLSPSTSSRPRSRPRSPRSRPRRRVAGERLVALERASSSSGSTGSSSATSTGRAPPSASASVRSNADAHARPPGRGRDGDVLAVEALVHERGIGAAEQLLGAPAAAGRRLGGRARPASAGR